MTQTPKKVKKAPSDRTALSLGTYLRNQRKHLGLSQKEVAAKLSYRSPQFVSNWERDRCSPPVRRLARLVAAYRLKPSTFIRLWLKEEKKKVSGYLLGK